MEHIYLLCYHEYFIVHKILLFKPVKKSADTERISEGKGMNFGNLLGSS